MKSGTVDVKNITLAFDRFGDDGDPTILLLMGNSAPGLVWPAPFCMALAEAGFRVIRYDQRDTGLSTYLDFEASPLFAPRSGRRCHRATGSARHWGGPFRRAIAGRHDRLSGGPRAAIARGEHRHPHDLARLWPEE